MAVRILHRLSRPLLVSGAGVLGLVVALACAGPAAADGLPIMPLSQVHGGMSCQGLSVVQGTTISSFDVQVIDVVAGDAGAAQPLILVSVSGPAVDQSGIAEGFSGSPILCPDGQGVQRVIGAIGYGAGDYGNKMALATPIESILGQPVDPPAGVRTDRALVRSARPLAAPLSVAGLAPPVADAYRALAARHGRELTVAPFAPVSSAFPPQQLVPGASMAVGLADGDLSAGAIGTVSYADGDAVWGFGHPLDGVGRRSLLLEDAYVYAVIANPLDVPGATSVKLAAPGHALGTLTADGPNAVAGRVGALPPQIPLHIAIRDGDTGQLTDLHVSVADESGVGLPTGASALSTLGPMALSQAAYTAVPGMPAAIHGSMCVTITVRERPHRLGFCNDYAGASGMPGGGTDSPDGGDSGVPGEPLVDDLGTALSDLDAFKLGELHITDVTVHATIGRGLDQAYLVGATGPRVVRRARRVRVRLLLRMVRGPLVTRTVNVRIARHAALGDQALVFTGSPADGSGGGGAVTIVLGALLGGGDSGPPVDTGGPPDVAALAGQIAGIHRFTGLRERQHSLGHVRPGGGRRVAVPGGLRVSGWTALPVSVRR